jgi:predicted MFS family arabinose efflux permease
MGIASAGVGLGIFLVVPLFQASIDAWGWRATFRVFAIACAAWIVPSSLLLVRGSSYGEGARQRTEQAFARGATGVAPPAATRSMTLAQSMRSAPLWLMVAVYFFGNVAAQTLHVHQVAYLVDHGIAAMAAASVVGVVGVASIFGKIGGGWLSDRIEREIVYVVGIAAVVASIGILAVIGQLQSHWIAYAYAALFGAGYSVTASLMPAIVSDRFGGPHFGAIVGFGMVGGAVGAALGAWLAGRLFDATGTYAIPFWIAAGAGAAAAGAVWWARVLRVRAKRAAETQAAEPR